MLEDNNGNFMKLLELFRKFDLVLGQVGKKYFFKQ